MPITPAYTWKESPSWVSIHITLRSLSPSSLHILTTDSYVKINSYPYLFQADLFADVDNARSNAIVDNNVVKFFLFKRKEELWGRLTAVGEKEDILSRREKSMELARQHSSKMKEDAKLKCAKLGRLAVHNQIKLEEDKRKIIESRKEVELNQEREDIQRWQEEFQSEHDSSKVISNGSENKTGGTTLGDSDHFDVDNAENSRERKDMMHFCGKTNENKHDINKMVKKHDLTEPHEKKGVFNSRILTSPRESVSDQTTLPAPRKNMCITVKFSPKSLPPKLPARESRDEQVCFKENNTTPSDAIDVSEREPLFLFDKGNKFYRNGDMRSAINAYTDAIKKDPSLFISFVNRAACHLHMQHFDSCIDDCTAVLKILQEAKMHEAHEEKLLQLLCSFGTSSPGTGESRPDQERELSAKVEFIKKAAFELLSSPKSSITGKSEENLHSLMNDCTLFVVLSRRGFAKCSLKDTEGSKSDFAKALNLDANCPEIEYVYTTVQRTLSGIEN